MGKKITILLVCKKGGDFNLEDVFLLSKNIQKHWNKDNPLELLCATDFVPPMSFKYFKTIELPFKYNGWWSKMNLFSPNFHKYLPFLYLDLDTIVKGDLSSLVPEENEKDFITLSDFYKPMIPASGIMWIGNMRVNNILWLNWFGSEKEMTHKFRGDQNFINAFVKPNYLFQQDITNRITTFKPNFMWRTEEPVEDIVCFHGKPRIHEAAETIEWVRKYKEDE